MTYYYIYEQKTLAKMSENHVRIAQHNDYRYKQYTVKHNYIFFISIILYKKMGMSHLKVKTALWDYTERSVIQGTWEENWGQNNLSVFHYITVEQQYMSPNYKVP